MMKLTNDQEKFIHKILEDKHGVEPNEITPESKFENDFGMDSLDKVELIIDVENEFKINISEYAIEEINTLDELYKAVESRLEP